MILGHKKSPSLIEHYTLLFVLTYANELFRWDKDEVLFFICKIKASNKLFAN